MKTFCLCGGANEALANFCGKCGKSLNGQISVAKVNKPQAISAATEEDSDYKEFLKFKESRRKQPVEDDEGSEDYVPRIAKLSLKAKQERKNTFSLKDVINTASAEEAAGFSRPLNNIDVNKFMEDRGKWISTQNVIEM